MGDGPVSPLPGTVIAVHVKEGENVKEGDLLMVVEAMKMENVLRADRDAVVCSLKASVGDSLSVDQVIMDFE